LGLILLLSSCNSIKNLVDDQSFLMSNKVKVKSDYPIENKSELTENLLTLYRQSQTKYSLGFPRHVYYYKYQEKLAQKPNKKKWDDERVIKNRPVIFDSLKVSQTSDDFKKYLGLRGYRSAAVSYDIKTSGRKTHVNYLVNAGPRLFIDTFIIVSRDSTIQQIVDTVADKILITKGNPLDVQQYNLEKLRLVRLLQNEGYATFDESFISPLEVDTSGGKVKATMRLLNPTDSTFHQKYRVGNVSFYPDYDIVAQAAYYDTVVNRITYFLPDSNYFTLKPEAIQRSLYLKPGEYTRRDNLDRTIKNLGRIELIKFVTPTGTIDSSHIEAPEIDYAFYLTRNKKINFDLNGELTYSNIAADARRSLFGTAFSTNYRDRNIFGKAEVFNVNMELGFEFNFFNRESEETSELLNSLNAGLGTDLSFRRFMDPLRIYHMIGYSRNPDKRPLIGGRLHYWLLEESTSRLNLGFNYSIITDLYEYYNVNANLNYDIQPDPFKKLTITRIGFDLFVPTAKPAYQEILDENKFLAESFGNQLYTGFLFRNYLYEINSKVRSKAGYFKVLHSAELSGLEMYAINSTANLISGNFNEFLLNTGGGAANAVEFSQFVKGEMDIRYYRDLTPRTKFAIKFNIGIASAYGPYTQQVPYPKQFYVGGALSNRAWQIRQLGPGGYQDTAEIKPNIPYYQTGDFKIDVSAELRFKLFWYFDGVIFMDAANVWTLKYDPDRPEADLSKTFYKEFGIGYGYGIRLDLDFFIIRLDLGYKLHNPYRVPYSDTKSSRWLVNELKRFPSGAEPQIAVGLPF
jgi:outer membrane protein insertion porin family